MGVYALVSTLESLGKLAFAYVTIQIGFDHLCFYSGTLLFVALWFKYLRCPKSCTLQRCKILEYKGQEYLQAIVIFSGWTIFGSIANTSMIQGGIILINIFFGPIINAAFGVALQINNAVSALVNSMIVPFRPTMQRNTQKAIRSMSANYLRCPINSFIMY